MEERAHRSPDVEELPERQRRSEQSRQTGGHRLVDDRRDGPPADPRSVWGLQSGVGNAAVNSLFHDRRRPGVELPRQKRDWYGSETEEEEYPQPGRGRGAEEAVQRENGGAVAPPSGAAPTPGPAGATSSPVVADDASDVQSGQMKKASFLTQLRAAVVDQVPEVGDEDVEPYFNDYLNKPAELVQSTLEAEVAATADASTAEQYIATVVGHVKENAAAMPEAGTAEPPPMERPRTLTQAVRGKARIGERLRHGDDATTVRSWLGAGEPLDSSVRSRMETALGRNLAGISVHRDTAAATAANRVNARAFTVGRDVAFGAGEYAPGTPIGDALLAHELAHVQQQGDGSRAHESASEDSLEDAADHAAVSALARLYAPDDPATASLRQGAAASLASGLRVQRCSGSRFPHRSEIHASPTVMASLAAAWTAATADFGERFAWVTWNARTKAYSIVGPNAGTWLGVTPPPRPTDAAPVFHVGEYHLHPPLPPGQVSANYPVGPSGQDTTAATADDSPGIVRDFTDTTRTTVTDYEYGPERRTQNHH